MGDSLARTGTDVIAPSPFSGNLGSQTVAWSGDRLVYVSKVGTGFDEKEDP